jgi:hypothetical protein
MKILSKMLELSLIGAGLMTKVGLMEALLIEVN